MADLRRNTLLVGLGVVTATAIVAWSLSTTNTELVAAREVSPAATAGPPVAVAVAPDVLSAAASDAEVANVREQLEAGPPRLRLRLRGLHADVPWTEAVIVRLIAAGEDDVFLDAVPDADGRCSWTLPRQALGSSSLQLWAEARDPAYEWLDYLHDGPLDPSREIVIDVRVVAIVEGRVLDANAAPVDEARVTAFAIRDGAPTDERIGRAQSHADGSYRLHVPPDVPLLLLATAMQPMGNRRIMAADRNGDSPDSGTLRPDLLPASREVQARAGQPTPAIDLVLPMATPATGRVCWNDGTPIALATVQTVSNDALTFGLEAATFVQRLADGTLVPGGSTDTDDDGAFTLPAIQDRAIVVTLASLQEAELVGSAPSLLLLPPYRRDLLLPRPVHLVAMHRGKLVRHGAVTIANGRTLRTNATGSLDLVCVETIRLRVHQGEASSPWIDVRPEAAGATVTVTIDD